MELDETLQLFIVEARELLEQMEDALLRVEQMPEDADTINAIFRAAHTIKGSAGLFGLEHIVRFTHTAESVLDRVRSGQLAISSDLVVVLLGVCDHLGGLITRIAEGAEHDEETQRSSDELVHKLNAWLPGEATPSSSPPVAPGKEAGDTEAVSSDNWHLSLRFSPDVLRNGMDPLSFIRYLKRIGEIVEIVTLIDHVPALSELDPEACYLGFEISFRTDVDKTTIEGVFEFVRDDAHICILPPHSRISKYLKLIDEMPEEEMLLGEILVRCGTLTRAELEGALSSQATGREEPHSPIGQVLMDQKIVHPQVVAAALDKQKKVKETNGTVSGSIRVNADKLDEHINQIGELIIASAGASLIAQHASNPSLLEALARLSRLVEEIRDSALSLRMVQIGATFNRFQRVVRDVSAELGKDIRLEIAGAETELDKTVVEKIADPLTHLVRNSMDHGIEAADERLARGKPAQGTIKLNAFHDSGSIVIEVSDDGGGLKRERIRAKAVERGLIRADQTLSAQDIDNLIFEPGFSTAEEVSNLSGRGVGMDVVRRNIAALRGSIEITSREGLGTSLRIRLPLTLAIIDGFLVGVGSSCFVIPLDMVIECVELTVTGGGEDCDHLNLRGEVLPFIRIKQLFAVPDSARAEPGDAETSCGGPSASNTSLLSAEGAAALAADDELRFLLDPVQRENVVVVEYAGHRAGLVVDRLRGEFQTVIRPLGAIFEGLDGISGFTILGDGRVALIIDVPGLIHRVIKNENMHRQSRSIAFTGEGK